MVRITHYGITAPDIKNTCLEQDDVNILLSEKEIETYRKSLQKKYEDSVHIDLTYVEVKKE